MTIIGGIDDDSLVLDTCMAVNRLTPRVTKYLAILSPTDEAHRQLILLLSISLYSAHPILIPQPTIDNQIHRVVQWGMVNDGLSRTLLERRRPVNQQKCCEQLLRSIEEKPPNKSP